MFKLHRPSTNKLPKQRQRVDFKFSNFQALQVPKGWDRLYVSIVCAETGKTMAKLGKALVKNGSCQWTEALSESIYMTRDASSNAYDECLFKLLVSTGSTRSSPLGEVVVDMSQYTSARVATTFSQPLKKCSYGTILQVKIQCSTPRSKIGDEESKNSTPKSVENDRQMDLDNPRSSNVRPPSEDFGTTSHPIKLDSEEGSQSESSGASQSFDSVKKLSRKNALKSEVYEYNAPDFENVSPSNESSSNSKLYSRHDFQSEQAVNRFSATNYLGSSKNLLEAAEDTIAQLRAEAKMWERNARKLMIDLDISKKEFSDLSKKEKELVVELSAEHAEKDGLNKEVAKLKLELQNRVIKEDSVGQSEGLVQIQKVLENEIKYQQDLNHNLDQQLKQSQESNIELVSVLQELEETIEKQRIEIENLESSVAKISMDNSKLEGDVRLLEESLRDKTDEIASLEATLSGYGKGEHFEALDDNSNENDVREIELLREKIRELEKDCTELTDENLELLFKLKESNKMDMRKCASFDSMSSEHATNVCCPSDDSEVSDRKFQICHLEEELKKKVEEEQNVSENYSELNKILEMKLAESEKILEELEKSKAERDETCANLMKELEGKRLEIDVLEANLVAKVQEVDFLSREKIRLEQNIELALREKNISLESLENLQNDLTALRGAVGSHVSANENLERDLETVENKRRELENSLSGLHEENTRLHERIKQLKDENESLTFDLERKFDDMQKQWLLAQEECEYLKQEMKLRNSNSEVETENQELRENCSALVARLNESNKSLSDCSLKVELLEGRLASMVDDFEVRENGLKSQLDALVKENSCQKEKLALEESLHQMYLEKSTEFESLSKQLLSEARKERERISLEASGEISRLIAERDELRASLEEVKLKAESYDSKLEAAMRESELAIQELTGQLVDSKRSLERALSSLAGYKRSDEKLKSELNDLELKLTISDYERQQLIKETSNLKVQLQSLSILRDEISTLKSELEDCRVDKGKFEHALKTISGDYEEVKAENNLFKEKVSEFEECKRTKLALEEKLLQMEKELSEKEILCVRKTDLENELTEMKKSNVEFQKKMYRLEEERDECLKKAQSLEENIKLMEERNINNNNMHEEGGYNGDFDGESPLAISVDPTTKQQLFENEVAEGSDANNRVLHGRYERTKSSFETELRELRERYLEMSLKYAEVETQREDLVMQLKAARSGKRWFA
ncbi:hypothetical protein ABFX02_10G046800 [Erythranthe guttata]